MRKEQVLETIKDLPSEFDLDTVVEKLIFIDKVEKGLIQIKEGKTISHQEVKKRIGKWSE